MNKNGTGDLGQQRLGFESANKVMCHKLATLIWSKLVTHLFFGYNFDPYVLIPYSHSYCYYY